MLYGQVGHSHPGGSRTQLSGLSWMSRANSSMVLNSIPLIILGPVGTRFWFTSLLANTFSNELVCNFCGRMWFCGDHLGAFRRVGDVKSTKLTYLATGISTTSAFASGMSDCLDLIDLIVSFFVASLVRLWMRSTIICFWR